jgi:hypothetical protein
MNARSRFADADAAHDIRSLAGGRSWLPNAPM